MQLSELNTETTDVNEKGPDISGFNLKGHVVLLRPVHVSGKTKGGLLLANKTQQDVSYLMNVCEVLAIGPTAYTQEQFLNPRTNEIEQWCKVGDFVLIPRLSGQKIKYKGVPLTIISCDRIIATLDNPEDIDPNFNISFDSRL
jgi:co-chaperonin GroES (HSP10)